MKLTELVQKITRNFLIIFASIIIMITVLRQMYYPNMAFDLNSIYIIMIFSFISSFIGFILYSPNDLSEKNIQIRRALHFFTLEVVLIVLAIVFGLVENTSDAIILALQIAVIYFVVRLLSWQKDKKEAKKINERLKEMKKLQ